MIADMLAYSAKSQHYTNTSKLQYGYNGTVVKNKYLTVNFDLQNQTQRLSESNKGCKYCNNYMDWCGTVMN